MGGSSDLCALLKPGEPVILMGPTGTPTEIAARARPSLLVGGGLGNAVLFSIGQALRAAGSQVLYFAGYKKMHRPLQGRGDRGGGRRRRLVLRRGAGLHARPRRRTGPSSATSSQAMAAYARGELGDAADPAARRRPHHRHRLRRHDGGRRRARGTACSRRT